MIDLSNSREFQDLFVLSILDKKRNGTYLEIGSGHPIAGSNTFLLENNYNWKGISLELDSHLFNTFIKTRKNICLNIDATNVDYYNLIMQMGYSTHIDFLQLDIDPAPNTFKALNKINFEKLSFSIITFEHDLYQGHVFEKHLSRDIITSYGYTLVKENVMHDNDAFEDWYINEKFMPNNTWRLFCGDNEPMNKGFISEKYLEIFNTL
jgi:hypothetical protein